MTLVAGVDSSTQSCKVLVVDAESGAVVREGRASHPEGTEVDPEAWWMALQRAVVRAGGLDDVHALSVGGQQHGMVCLDDAGDIVRPALLWNDNRSAGSARDLIADLGGTRAWADAVGSVPVASFTATKLRWMADHEPDNVERTSAVCLPHDWLTWRLREETELDALATDRSDASGTGYWSPAAESYCPDLLELALGKAAVVPEVLGPREPAGHHGSGVVLGPGCGDNAGAALGLGASEGTVVVSIGTSGVVSAVSSDPATDPDGVVAGFADATGRFLPLVVTLNAARVLDATARMLGVDHDRLSELALSAPEGSGGLVLVPYLEGERTPVKPFATGSLHGLTLATSSPAHVARAAVEGLLCALADGVDVLVAHGARVDRILLVGGGASSEAVRRTAPIIFGRPVHVPDPGEYVAKGAARQAAWVLAGSQAPPPWTPAGMQTFEGAPGESVRARYAEARDATLDRQ